MFADHKVKIYLPEASVANGSEYWILIHKN